MADALRPGAPISVFVAQAARRFAGRTALIHGERRWSFSEFDAIADAIATGLRQRLEPGERVCSLMSNRPEYLFLQAAVERAGLVRVPINARLTAIEVAAIVLDCAASALFHDETTAAMLSALAGRPGLWL
jgi:acyl-CoA synthetase (AMP-forming)/AMP-acid ligase II